MKRIENGILYDEPMSIWLPATCEVDSNTGEVKKEIDAIVETRIKITDAKKYSEIVEALKDLKNFVKTWRGWCDPIGKDDSYYSGEGYYSFYYEEEQDTGRSYWNAQFYENPRAKIFQLLTGAAAYESNSSYLKQTNVSFDLCELINVSQPKYRFGVTSEVCDKEIEHLRNIVSIFENRGLSAEEIKMVLEHNYPNFVLFATGALNCVEFEVVSEMSLSEMNTRYEWLDGEIDKLLYARGRNASDKRDKLIKERNALLNKINGAEMARKNQEVYILAKKLNRMTSDTK